MTEAHRRRQLAIRAAALRDVARLWGGVNPRDLSGTIGRFADAAVVTVAARRAASAQASARYFARLRAVEGVPGEVVLPQAAGLSERLIASQVRGAGLSGILDARRRGFPVEAASRQGLVRASGTASNLVLDGGRELVREAMVEDRRAVGWMRVTSGDPCPWCAMLASRGPVYRTEATASFDVPPDQFHDHDGCQIEPVFREDARDDRSQWPASSQRLRERWEEVTDGLSSADARRAFQRALTNS